MLALCNLSTKTGALYLIIFSLYWQKELIPPEGVRLRWLFSIELIGYIPLCAPKGKGFVKTTCAYMKVFQKNI